MYKIRWGAVFIIAGLLLTGCGEQKNTSEILLYQSGKEEEKEVDYKTTSVRKATYKETVSGTGELYYTTENTVSVDEENTYLDKICVKNHQKVKKGDILAIYHVRTSKASLQKKKLLLEQAKSKYEAQLKSKESEVLAKEKAIDSLTSESEIKIARIELKRLKNEYKKLVSSGKDVRKQEQEYKTLLRKQKKAVLKSAYTGTVVNATTVNEWEETTIAGEKLMTIRDESDFLIQVQTDTGGLRYNMTVDIALGSTTENIKYRLKGRVISTDNLYSSGSSDEEESSVTTLVKVSQKDMAKYPFDKYNIYVTGVTLRIENALLVDSEAVYEETQENDVKLFVYLLEEGKLHKRYIVSNYKQDKYYLVNQGLEEGQTLAVIRN
ncbi:MAG: efflux RND transporter periplasmic adaptor subunit [Eubacterium sp.]|nr:efflux RND transporter periplasmic adaptor subunit [Eubacterium sp.]